MMMNVSLNLAHSDHFGLMYYDISELEFYYYTICLHIKYGLLKLSTVNIIVHNIIIFVTFNFPNFCFISYREIKIVYYIKYTNLFFFLCQYFVKIIYSSYIFKIIECITLINLQTSK